LSNIFWVILIIALLVDLLFSAVRSSLLNTHPAQLIDLKDQNPEGVEKALSVLDKKRLRISLRISLILMHFIISCATLLLVIHLFPDMPVWGVFAVIIFFSFIILLLEFAVEGLVLHNPEGWTLKLAPLGNVMEVIFTPVAALMMAVLGSPEALQTRLSPVTEEEIRSWVNSAQGSAALEQDEREMIYSIFQFGETLSREIMIPRMDITALDVNSTGLDAIRIFTESGHSRVPVFDETIDNIIGLLYAKDLLQVNSSSHEIEDIRPFLRKAYFIPESKNVDELLREMQSQGIHMAVVVDEYGGTAGVVTLEDIVEEIVGEIRDEYDQGEEHLVQKISDDEYVFSGRVGLDDVFDNLHVDLNSDIADTLGGFIYGQIGRVPLGGEQIKVDGWVLTVSLVSGRRIRKILAKRETVAQESQENHEA
jgi:CBS domain containing-hemolysin-like protein